MCQDRRRESATAAKRHTVRVYQTQFCKTAATLLATVLGLGSVRPVSAEQTMRPVSDMFEPLSTPAESIHELALLTLIISGVIFFVVSGLLAWAVVRYRRRPGGQGKEPPQVYGSMQIELAWTVIPIIIVFSLILVTARTIGEIQNAKIPEDAQEIRLIGRQWWWEVHYPKLGVVTANEIHVPIGEVSHIILESADVIHSFWVPQLAGKTDVVPNHRNETWIEPKAEGVFFGNCAEYCGTQHANMLLRVIVESPEDYAKGVANEKAPPVDDPAVAAGKKAFFETSCVNCHTLGSNVATGTFGPDLTHLMSRQTIGAGAAPNDYENLLQWIRDPQVLKPGCLMPDMLLDDQQVIDITDYLSTLK
jgi:cytochrome c oxidase subunit II